MTKTMEKAIEQLRSLPDNEQEAAAFAVLELLDARRDTVLTDEQLAEVRRRRSQPRGELLTLEQVRASLRRLGA